MLVTKPVLQPLKALRMGKQFVANVLAFGASACVFQENPYEPVSPESIFQSGSSANIKRCI